MATLHWWEYVGRSVHRLVVACGGAPLIEYLRHSRLESMIEAHFPTTLKENVTLLIISTAVMGALFGFLLFYFVFGRRHLPEVEEEELFISATRESRRRSSTNRITEVEEEEEDDAVAYKLLRGQFNSDVIKSLHRWSNDNGELVKLDKQEVVNASTESLSTESPSSTDEDEDKDSKTDEKPEQSMKPAKKTKGASQLEGDEMLFKLENLHGKLATAKLRQESMHLKQKMSVNEREEEARIKAQQLEAILSLMKAEKDKFGIHTEEELNEQMESLYNI